MTETGMKRKDFSKIPTRIPIPNLIHVQRESYTAFLQMDKLPEERENRGLQAVFTSIFPFSNFRETCSIDFVHYTIGDWQCRCGKLEGLQFMRLPCKNCGWAIGKGETYDDIESFEDGFGSIDNFPTYQRRAIVTPNEDDTLKLIEVRVSNATGHQISIQTVVTR